MVQLALHAAARNRKHRCDEIPTHHLQKIQLNCDSMLLCSVNVAFMNFPLDHLLIQSDPIGT
jgi:hypothetical protein